MDWRLDKECNPIWLCKAAGVLCPSFLLLAGVVWAAIRKGQNATDWFIISLCSCLLVAFLLRYRSGKVASLFEEFLFGAFLAGGVIMLFPAPHHDRDWWSTVLWFGLCFLGAAVKYVRLFYLRSNRNPEH